MRRDRDLAFRWVVVILVFLGFFVAAWGLLTTCGLAADPLLTPDYTLSPETILNNQPLRLIDPQGRDYGELSRNPYRPDALGNEYGKHGNRFSQESLNNPYSEYNRENFLSPRGGGFFREEED